MTHQNHQTNGASLEDCHTNFFALTDLCGIKWRKYLIGERPQASGEPLDDPVLRSYARCLECEILCVWRRVAAPKQEPDPNNTISYDLVTSHTHPPLSLTAAKELWIFWYGEEPDLTGLLDQELLRTPCVDGAWENGLSYECRSLLFKALHNLIERCLLSKDLVRLGKWFVQPCTSNDKIFRKSSQHLSFAFAFFVHGDTVCASIDLREHPAVRPLTPDYLAEAAALAATSNNSNDSSDNNDDISSQNRNNNINGNCANLSPGASGRGGGGATTPGPGNHSSNNSINNSTNNNSTTNNSCSANSDVPKTKSVILAPYGLAATLTGKSFRKADPGTEKFLDDWRSFYPLCNKENSDLPPFVEVISGGVKMRYPSKYVLVTDLDEINNNNFISNENHKINSMQQQQTNQQSNVQPTNNDTILLKSATAGTKIKQEDCDNPTTINNSNNNNDSNNNNKSNVVTESKTITLYETFINNTFGNLQNTHTLPTAAIELPERVWQDCITTSTTSTTTQIEANMAHMNINNLTIASSTTVTTISNSNNISSSTTTQQQTTTEIKIEGGGTTTITIPNNNNNNDNIDNGNQHSSHNNNINSESKSVWDFNDPLQKSTCICIRSSVNQDVILDTGGTSTYSRNSIGDSMPVPSVGSPGSVAMSPHHPNSQPTSVPPPELIPVISPRGPTSVPSLQPPTPLENHLDKNTPAPTPTDQHDNKSITASPYVQPTPSVEAPPSVDNMLCSSNHGNNNGGSNDDCNNLNGNNNNNVVSNGELTAGIVKKFEPIDDQHLQQLNQQDQQQIQNQQQQNQQQNNFLSSLKAEFNNCGINNNTSNKTSDRESFFSLFKRPKLSTKDFDCSVDDDSNPQLLYDYTTLNAWMDHPVKRFRPNTEDIKPNRKRGRNLYESHTHQQPPPMLSPNSMSLNYIANDIKKEVQCDYESSNMFSGNSFHESDPFSNNLIGSNQNNLHHHHHDAKKKGMTDAVGKCKSSSTGNLFTEQGLQVSPGDLDDLFDNPEDISGENSGVENSGDNSNDETAIQVHTPPDSNASMNGCGNTEEIKRSNTGILRPEELSKMFPTPPSHEHHPNSSPMSGGGMMDIPITDLNESGGMLNNMVAGVTLISGMISTGCGGGTTPTSVQQNANIKVKQDIYSDLGSPPEEPIEDWSYVYIPDTICKVVGSTKYAPLTNLPSQSLPPLSNPPNTYYKPSWLQQVQRQQHQQHHQQQQQHHPQQQLQQMPQQQHLQMQQQLQQPPQTEHLAHALQQPRTPINNINSSFQPNNIMPGAGTLNNLNQIIDSNQTTPGKLTPIHSTSNAVAANPLLVNQLNYRPPTPANMLRPGMSPISPAPPGVPANFISNSPMNHRRTPIHPPPPYDVAIASPATSTSSYKQFNSQEPRTPMSQLGCGGQTIGNGNGNGFNSTSRSPEANSLLINVLLYDTALNVFRDHNFDSCTLCVCNATQQCVGNIRGSDSGLYVALPGSSFNPAVTSNSNGLNSGPNSSLINSSNKLLLGAISGQNCSSNNSNTNSIMRSSNNLSAFGIDSPSCGTNSQSSTSGNGGNGNSQHLTGYVDEDQIRCSCGFSAVINRRLAYRSGLFYEDEMEITGMAEDPFKYKKKSILQLFLDSGTDCGNNSIAKIENSKLQEPKLPQAVMDLLRDQCSIIQTSTSSIQRALQRCSQEQYIRRKKQSTSRSESGNALGNVLNILEFIDANDVCCLAIEQGRIFFENSGNSSSMLEPYQSRGLPTVLQKTTITVHKWPYVLASGTRNNQDIVRLMKSMQPLLQNAFHHSKCRPRRETATYTVKGPLTWRQFHRLAGRGTGQCEPQPIPSIIVGHEKDWLAIAPYAIHYWDKLLLEPYSYSRDVVYLVIAPENDFILSKTKSWFKELSTTYEMCKLGRHTPIKGWEGILQVGQKSRAESSSNTNNSSNISIEDWLQSITNTKLSERIRMYSSAFQNLVGPYLQRVPNDKSLLDPPESEKITHTSQKDRPIPSPMPPPSTPDPSQPSGNATMQSIPNSGNMIGDKAPNTPKTDEKDCDALNNSTSTTNSPISDPLRNGTSYNGDDDINPPVIVLYVVEPFTSGNDSTDLQRIACLTLIRIYSELLSTLPESIRHSINLQIVSLESILELGRNRSRLRYSDEMKNFALSVFSQCKRFLQHSNTAKSLTGFGTAANMEIFLKTKDEKNKIPYKMYTPPYILAPIHEKSEKLADSFRSKQSDQQYSVMYCNYCISEDQSWLLATATDDRGELLETITINIDIPNRARRRRGIASSRRLGLKKLMDFILGIISQTTIPWRLVVGRIGRIGHGELKSWSWLLSKQNLQKASKQLKDLCKQCTLMYPNAVPSILSACLVTLEPDSKLRVMPDQFTPDERFSQISMQNPLSTPQDVTCTHILVFPTSAVCQSFQKAFNELNETEAFDSDNNFIFDFGDDPQEELSELGGDFMDWDQLPERNSNHGSPGRIEDNRSRQSPSGNMFNSNCNMLDAQDMEEVGAVLQQPLAVGYFVSTAPTGRMPSWFWSSCPHLEDVCPVFLKTALHLHVPSIQNNTEDPLTQNHSSANDHPLDSGLTADVLRYVLEGYNVLSWLALDSNTHDRLSCLPIHVQVLMQLYHMTTALT